jgi:hypothetical protein
MTVIACRSGIIAADSRETWESEAGGISFQSCQKLFRKRIGRRDVIIGTAGGTYLGMVFVDWWGSSSTDKQPPEILRDAHLEEDFEVLLVDRGKMYTANHLCRPVEVQGHFIAIGCGRKAAMAAMLMGASAIRACEIACKVDPFCAPPIVHMTVKTRTP